MGTTRAITSDEYERLKAEAGRSPRTGLRDRALVVLLRRAGLRISEALSLRMADVLEPAPAGSPGPQTGARVVSELQVARRNVKGKHRGRVIPLHPEAVEAIRAWTAAMALAGWQRADTWLFRRVGPENRPVGRTQAWKAIRRSARAAGIGGCVAPHSLRKTFGKAIYEASGHDIRMAQEGLGHDEVTSTQQYLANDRDRLRELILGDSVGER